MNIVFSLRAKILLFSSFLFTIPYLGYQYIWELETYLRIGQEQTLVGTARSVATSLHERPSLFAQESALLNNIEPGRDLYAPQISQPIRLDGNLDDWSAYQKQVIEYDDTYMIEQRIPYNRDSFRFTHMVGQYGQYLYVMFNVTDETVINRNENMLSIHKNDFIQIAMRDPFGQFQRYIVAPYDSGWVNAYQLKAMTSDASNYQPAQLERRIQGYWQNTKNGYQVELRFPLTMMQGNIAFAISDVDDEQTREILYQMGTANPERIDALGTVIVPSPEIEQIIQGLTYADARVWIVDKHQRVLARAGDIQTAGNDYNALLNKPDEENIIFSWLSGLLRPIYEAVLTTPPQTYIDELADATSLEGQAVRDALAGEANTHWRLSQDKKAVILSAAHPIYVANEVMGAVVVEQTTNGIRTLRNQALEKQFLFFLAIILFGTLALFLLASRISNRIRNLRNSTEAAIDKHGKIQGQVTIQQSKDEIGDLSRSFASMLNRLGQYNQYLENMASRLSHELRTPVAVVKSSLENLELIQDKNSVEAEIFVLRAKEGLARLSYMLHSMSEATRLEQVIENTDKQEFDLVPFLHNYAKSIVVPEELSLDYSSKKASHIIHGSPELFAQMLDKIIENSFDFATPHTIVSLSMSLDGEISVTNVGHPIAHDMKDVLFDSMVSVRSDNPAQKGMHLGLGLYIAKMIATYHGMVITIDNIITTKAVKVSLKML
jgi:two-component system, OmpR family, sensor histidine kinase ChvG